MIEPNLKKLAESFLCEKKICRKCYTRLIKKLKIAKVFIKRLAFKKIEELVIISKQIRNTITKNAENIRAFLTSP